jgi:hypothetical protein
VLSGDLSVVWGSRMRVGGVAGGDSSLAADFDSGAERSKRVAGDDASWANAGRPRTDVVRQIKTKPCQRSMLWAFLPC